MEKNRDDDDMIKYVEKAIEFFKRCPQATCREAMRVIEGYDHLSEDIRIRLAAAVHPGL